MSSSAPYHCRNKDGQDQGMLWIIPCRATASPVLDGTRSLAPQTLLPARAGKPIPGTRLRAHCGLPSRIRESRASTCHLLPYTHPAYPSILTILILTFSSRRQRRHHATSCSSGGHRRFGCRRPVRRLTRHHHRPATTVGTVRLMRPSSFAPEHRRRPHSTSVATMRVMPLVISPPGRTTLSNKQCHIHAQDAHVSTGRHVAAQSQGTV